jgi:hypothetical protein
LLTYAPDHVVEKLQAAALDIPEIHALLSGIQELDSALKQTDVYLKETKSHISIWDRINVLSKTSEEEMESDLKHEMREHSENMSHMLMRLHEVLLEVTRNLARTDESVRSFIVWSELHRLKLLISRIDVELSPFRSDLYINYTITGKNECIRLASELEEMTSLSADGPDSMENVLTIVKKKLLDNH